jgi:NACalpha-BTF3-like transcription factor
LARRYNNRRIVKSIQTIPFGRLLPGMIVTFNYSESGVTDPRPILLFLHRNSISNNLEGLNLNYLNPTKLKKLFQVMDFKKTKLDEVENLINLTEDYFRIQISNPKKRSAMSTKRFYSDVVSSDKYFKEAYRAYKLGKLTSLKVTQINTQFIQ